MTPAGTLAIALSLVSDTVMPLPVAAAVSVTVPVAEEPPATDSGEMLRFDSVGFADVTVKRVVLLTPPALAVITEELVLVVVPGDDDRRRGGGARGNGDARQARRPPTHYRWSAGRRQRRR